MKPLIRRFGGILGTIRAEYRQIFNRYFGKIERFAGTPKEICQQIIEKLWEGDFYRTSLGHFDFFWMRDFGTVCESLVRLGNQERVHHTLKWALYHYRRAGAVTLCIDQAGNTFNAPAKKSIDALPWLLHSLVVSKYRLNKREHLFLQQQAKKYADTFLKPNGQLIEMHYAEMRDAVYYNRSAYAVALVGRMAKCALTLRLTDFPFMPEIYEKELVGHYWNGKFFNADRDSRTYSSECALMPFFLRIVTDADMVDATCDYIIKTKLNMPYPLVYSTRPERFHYRFGMGKLIMPNYTGSTIWTWHGTFYLHILKRYHRPEYKEQYQHFTELIERHKTYPELVKPDGAWFYAPLYRADPGMVWAALFLEL